MATQLKAKRIAVLAKIEGVYGVDALPTGAANAILVSNPKLTPMDADRAERDVVRPFYGNAESIPVGVRSKFECEVELAGSGAAGTAPAWGPLLRACAFAEVITAGEKVEYTPVSDAIEAVSMYVNFDGVNHKLLGARGTVSFDLQNKQIPKMKFQFTGIYGGIADAVMPAVTLTAFKTPRPVDAVNTTALSLFGFSPAVQSVSLDMANSVVHRALPGSSESVLIVDRKPAGNISMEAVKVADKDWWSQVRAAATGTFSLTHGTVDGNIIELAAPAVQLGNPDYSESDGILMLSAPLSLVPGPAGNDEFTLTVR